MRALCCFLLLLLSLPATADTYTELKKPAGRSSVRISAMP